MSARRGPCPNLNWRLARCGSQSRHVHVCVNTRARQLRLFRFGSPFVPVLNKRQGVEDEKIVLCTPLRSATTAVVAARFGSKNPCSLIH